MRKFTSALTGVSAIALCCAPAYAQDAPADAETGGLTEIVVTAQKRSENINKVGLSITAVTADTLVKANITSASELQKVVPGFTFTDSPRGTPVFAIRGIGFQDSTVGSASTVATYVDEVSIPFPMENRFPTLDLERVEVLKGPQGILFGQNSTAGAINFIAAKPTQELRAGADLSYGRFQTVQGSAFISGGLTDNLRARLSFMGVHSSGWQTNRWLNGKTGLAYNDLVNGPAAVAGLINDPARTDSVDTIIANNLTEVPLGRNYQNDLGAKRGFAGRMLVEWEPTDRLTLNLNVNGWVDKSDTQAAQLLYAFPLQATAPYIPYNRYPTPPQDARSADWDPYLNTNRIPASIGKQEKLQRDDNFFQASLRADYKITDDLTFTSITAYSTYRQQFGLDVDGTALSNFSIGDTAKANSFGQEVRLTGDYGAIKFILGGNYDRHTVYEENRYYVDQSSVYVGFINNSDSGAFFNSPIRAIAAFGNVDFQPTDAITLHAGVRYTNDKRSYSGCTRDYGDGVQGNAFNIVIPAVNQAVFGIPYGSLTGAFAPNIQPGGCTSSNTQSDPSLVTAANPSGSYFLPGLANYTLKEDNVSWRFGVDFQATPTTLLYANVSRGYKSGGFPAVHVAANVQLEPVNQESITAYEVGVKAGLFDRRLQVNIAGFYNDYKNKQLRGRILDPFGFFGVLDKLLNIPKSRVWGGEIQVQAAPVDGLNINVGASYTDTKVTGDTAGFYDPVGNQINYRGLEFPNTPKWNVTAAIDYEREVTSSLSTFIGASMLYQSKTMGLFADRALLSNINLDPTLKPGVKVPSDAFDIKAYTTVDAQLGVKATDNTWKAWIWGKNVFNTYYWTNATQSFDSIYRLTAMPATYGASVSFRF
ncbi:MAG: TonB-dependent receptor [Pseudomonadota bacterium]